MSYNHFASQSVSWDQSLLDLPDTPCITIPYDEGQERGKSSQVQRAGAQGVRLH
jgi:hypothetical protein